MVVLIEIWASAVQQYKNYINGKDLIQDLKGPLKNFEVCFEKTKKEIIYPVAKSIYDEILDVLKNLPFSIEKTSYRVKEKYNLKMLRAIFEYPYSNHLNDIVGIEIITKNEIETVELAYTLLDKFRGRKHYILSPQGNNLFYDWVRGKEIITSFIPLEIDKKYITTGFKSIDLIDDLWRFMKNYYSRAVDELTIDIPQKYEAVHIDRLEEIGNMKLPVQIIITDINNKEIQKNELSHEWYVLRRLEHLKNNIEILHNEKEKKEKAYNILEELSS